MDRVQWQRNLRKSRRENGLCVGCGAELLDKKFVYCQECRDKENARKRELRNNTDYYLKQLMGNKAYKSRTQEERKKLGLCVQCGKQPAKANRVRCDDCLKKQANESKKYRDYRKDLGYCPRCGKNKIYCNESICEECNELVSKYRLANKDKIKEQQKISSKERSKKLKALGICVRCGKRKAKSGKADCEICLAKVRNAYHKNKTNIDRSEWPSYGICYLCGDSLDTDKKLCSKCVAKMTKNIKGKQVKNLKWQKDNNLIWKGAM